MFFYDSIPGLPSRQTQYKCKKCRFTLAGSNNVLPHWAEKEITWSKLMNKMLESESVEETRNIVRSSHSSSKHDDCKNGIFLGKRVFSGKDVFRNGRNARFRLLQFRGQFGHNYFLRNLHQLNQSIFVKL